MKRIVAIVLLVVMLFALCAACGTVAECDICGETKTCKQISILGETINICGDCQKQLNAAASLFGD